MSWPLSQDYNEAIQDPRVNFGDDELRAGEAVANVLGIPMPRSGNFADVYEVRCPSGARWAVKCFTREVHGLRERYAEISNYLRQVNLPFMVDFQYLEQGIRVRGDWFPVLKMQWVEGFVLNEFVRDNLDKKPILQALSDIWLRMARRLRKAKLAHCDLQHGNVLLVPGSTTNSLAVKLIDYDGMCVPSLAGKNSGEVGHPAFQHPERLRTGAYDREVDRFSLLSIATALRCLTVGDRSLWERYDNGDNLLFRQADLQAPAESPLFRELLAIGDPQGQLLVTELFRACQGPLAAVPLLTELIPEEPASKVKVRTRSEAAQEPDWDFGDGEPGAVIVSQRRRAAGMPLWAWGALGGAGALLVSVGAALVPHLLRIEKSASTIARNNPAAQPAAQARWVYLADLREQGVSALSFARRDGSKLNNKVSPNNLLLHPSDNRTAQVTFNIAKKYSRFKATVGIRDGANGGRGSETPLTFRVLGDDKELWKTASLQRCGDTRDCTVSVVGVERLQLQVKCPGTAYSAHAVWAEPRIEEDITPVPKERAKRTTDNTENY